MYMITTVHCRVAYIVIKENEGIISWFENSLCQRDLNSYRRIFRLQPNCGQAINDAQESLCFLTIRQTGIQSSSRDSTLQEC